MASSRVLVALVLVTLASSALAHGPSGAPVRPSRQSQTLWLRDLGVTWTPAFPPSAEPGYDPGLDLGHALSKPAAQGGWVGRKAPSLIAVYDPGSEDHLKRLAELDGDSRFLAASRLFNTYKVDARTFPKPPPEVHLIVYDVQGARVGEVYGKQLRRAYDLMEVAYKRSKGKKLSKVWPAVYTQLGQLARCDYLLRRMEGRIVCTDCGRTRDDVIKLVASTKKERREAQDEVARLLAF
ncbi:MAG: hypothetical protein CMJ83_20335 [Planctomycetes bacterium]|nr:hypothetical protein [Planctomycetota bacterium]